jgi:hypothetical protein
LLKNFVDSKKIATFVVASGVLSGEAGNTSTKKMKKK